MNLDVVAIVCLAVFGAVSSFANLQAIGALDQELLKKEEEYWRLCYRYWPTKRVVLNEAQKFVTIRNLTQVAAILAVVVLLLV